MEQNMANRQMGAEVWEIERRGVSSAPLTAQELEEHEWGRGAVWHELDR